MKRNITFIDQIIIQSDRALRTLTRNTQVASNSSPASKVDHEQELSEKEKKHVAGLMRVNHAGEVCAQALYQGQSITAKLETVRYEMERAADEEIDHLAWCESRLKELNEPTSVFNPLWYSLSFGLGATAGLVSDKISLGFVAATEEQVSEHLKSHLKELPKNDLKTREILKQMLDDEEAHGHAALDAGGTNFPKPVKNVMSLISKAMTKTSYYV